MSYNLTNHRPLSGPFDYSAEGEKVLTSKRMARADSLLFDIVSTDVEAVKQGILHSLEHFFNIENRTPNTDGNLLENINLDHIDLSKGHSKVVVRLDQLNSQMRIAQFKAARSGLGKVFQKAFGKFISKSSPSSNQVRIRCRDHSGAEYINDKNRDTTTTIANKRFSPRLKHEPSNTVKPYSISSHRNKDGTATPKLISHAFSLDGKGLSGAKTYFSLLEVGGFLSQQANHLISKNKSASKAFLKLSKLMHQAAQWIKTPQNTAKEALNILRPNGIDVVPSEKVIFSVLTNGNYKGKQSAHAMLCEITAQENGRCSLRFHNTGAGIFENHPSIVHPKGTSRYSPDGQPRRYQTFIEYKDIAIDKIDDIITTLQSFDTEEKGDLLSRVKKIYDYLDSLGTREPALDPKEYDKAQTMGNCSWKVLMHFIKHSIPYVDYLPFKVFFKESIIEDAKPNKATFDDQETKRVSPELLEKAQVKLEKHYDKQRQLFQDDESA